MTRYSTTSPRRRRRGSSPSTSTKSWAARTTTSRTTTRWRLRGWRCLRIIISCLCLVCLKQHWPDSFGDPDHHVVDNKLFLHLPLPHLPPVLLVVRSQTHRARPADHLPAGEDEGRGGAGEGDYLPLAGPVQESRRQGLGFQCSASAVHYPGTVRSSQGPGFSSVHFNELFHSSSLQTFSVSLVSTTQYSVVHPRNFL